MVKTKEIREAFPVHPGVLLFEELEERKIKAEDFAESCRLPVRELDMHLHNLRTFSAGFAEKLERTLGIPATIWLNLQNNYDDFFTRKRTAIYPAGEVARKVVAATNVLFGDSITNLKLQKLLYFLQGYFVVKTGKPLFTEDIQAWEFGPVVPEVYKEYRIFGSSALPVENREVVLRLSEDEEKLFGEVYKEYNRYSASDLVEMTHNQTPWIEHYNAASKNEVIPLNEIQSYFWWLINHPEVLEEEAQG